MVYLDNAATVMPCGAAVSAFNEAVSQYWQNPSSAYSSSHVVKDKLEGARASIASALGANPDEIIFTSGGTESNNLAILGLLKANPRLGKHIITTAGEHPAILNIFRALALEGYEVTFIPLKKTGEVDMDTLLSSIRSDTALISCMLANNETGAINDIGKIGAFLKQNRLTALLHTDAVQGFLKVPFTVSSLKCHALSLSAHKFGGVKGAGALYVKKGTKLSNIVYGGGQEGGLRSGTQATECILAMAAACNDVYSNFPAHLSCLSDINAFARKQINELGGRILSPENGAPHILSFSFLGYRSEVLLRLLDDRGICVSAGSACSTGKNARSHVLSAMKLDPKVIDGALRASFFYKTSKEDIEAFGAALKDALDSVIKV